MTTALPSPTPTGLYRIPQYSMYIAKACGLLFVFHVHNGKNNDDISFVCAKK